MKNNYVLEFTFIDADGVTRTGKIIASDEPDMNEKRMEKIIFENAPKVTEIIEAKYMAATPEATSAELYNQLSFKNKTMIDSETKEGSTVSAVASIAIVENADTNTYRNAFTLVQNDAIPVVDVIEMVAALINAGAELLHSRADFIERTTGKPEGNAGLTALTEQTFKLSREIAEFSYNENQMLLSVDGKVINSSNYVLPDEEEKVESILQ